MAASVQILNFTPSNTTYAITGATPTPALQKLSAKPDNTTISVRCYSPVTNTLTYLKFGDSTSVATTSDMPLPPGNTEIFDLQANYTHVSVLSASGSPVIYITLGNGS